MGQRNDCQVGQQDDHQVDLKDDQVTLQDDQEDSVMVLRSLMLM